MLTWKRIYCVFFLRDASLVSVSAIEPNLDTNISIATNVTIAKNMLHQVLCHLYYTHKIWFCKISDQFSWNVTTIKSNRFPHNKNWNDCFKNSRLVSLEVVKLITDYVILNSPLIFGSNLDETWLPFFNNIFSNNMNCVRVLHVANHASMVSWSYH